MNNLTNDQLRRIDAAMAEVVGYRIYSPGELYGRAYPHFTQARYELILWTADFMTQGLYWRPSTDCVVWSHVERWMAENFTRENRMEYTIAMRTQAEHPISEILTMFAMMTAPLPDRCIAFLTAMGRNVNEILAIDSQSVE